VVIGLERFRAWFEAYADQYVLIGGTAASIAMAQAGQDFRRTKDLDVVLHLEALTAEFGKRFWEFVEAGGYEICQSNAPEKPKLYRFAKPKEADFPFMVELFARAPIGFQLAPSSKLTPIPMDGMVTSLSAILLDEVYYDFLMAGRRNFNGLPWVGEDRLIPLKAMAWLSLTAQKAAGEQVDSKNISKHLKDILMLVGLLSPAQTIAIPDRIASDLQRFIAAVSAHDIEGINPKTLLILERLAAAYLRA
jgi:hypothetical protein